MSSDSRPVALHLSLCNKGAYNGRKQEEEEQEEEEVGQEET